LEDHQRATVPCILRPIAPVEGFNSNQEALLRSRKQSYTKLQEAEKWRKVYKVLFPYVQAKDIPSPCKTNNLLSLNMEHTELIINATVYDLNQFSESRKWFNRFMQHEIYRTLPLRFKRILETEMGTILQINEEKIRNIITLCTNITMEVIRDSAQNMPPSADQNLSIEESGTSFAPAQNLDIGYNFPEALWRHNSPVEPLWNLEFQFDISDPLATIGCTEPGITYSELAPDDTDDADKNVGEVAGSTASVRY
jgi:hypothetical protein